MGTDRRGVSVCSEKYSLGCYHNAKVPDNIDKMPDSDKRVPDKEQEQRIYEYVLKYESITTAKAAEILGVKQRRARAVLMNLIDGAYLKKQGAARSTVYVKNTEREY